MATHLSLWRFTTQIEIPPRLIRDFRFYSSHRSISFFLCQVDTRHMDSIISPIDWIFSGIILHLSETSPRRNTPSPYPFATPAGLQEPGFDPGDSRILEIIPNPAILCPAAVAYPSPRRDRWIRAICLEDSMGESAG